MRAMALSAPATPLRMQERHDPGLTSRPPSRNPAMKSDVDQRDRNTQRVDSVTRCRVTPPSTHSRNREWP